MPRLLILFLVACIVYAQHNTKDATRILKKKIGKYSKHGWNHYVPGYFTLDCKTGVLEYPWWYGSILVQLKKIQEFYFGTGL